MQILPVRNFIIKSYKPNMHNKAIAAKPLWEKYDSLSFLGRKPIAIYAKEIGNDKPIERFDSSKEASDALDIKSTSSISFCLSGKMQQAGGYAFIKASEIEDSKGKIDEEKAKKFVEETKNYKRSTGNHIKAIYIKKINNSEPAKRFDTIKEAMQELDIKNASDVSYCLARNTDWRGKYIFKIASEIEDKDGNVDEEKLKSFFEEGKNYKKSVYSALGAIYAKKIEGDEPLEKFDSIRDCEQKLDIKYSKIYSCIVGKRSSAEGYIFTQASNLENSSKTKIKPKKAKPQKSEKEIIKELGDIGAIYVIKIRSDEKPKRVNKALFSNICDKKSLLRCLKGELAQVNGYMLKKASLIEDKEGKIDEAKMAEFVQGAKNYSNTRAIYAIDTENGNKTTKFKAPIDAACAFGIDLEKIYLAISYNPIKIGNLAFIKAQDVEDIDGNLNLEVLEEYVENCDKNI